LNFLRDTTRKNVFKLLKNLGLPVLQKSQSDVAGPRNFVGE